MREEVKKKISESRKRFLKENPDQHPWRRREKQVSVPCERVKEFLRKEKIMFVEEFQPIEERFYSIDIAFPDIKVGIEINGNQHYNNDGTLKDYYLERHNLIVKEGWKLFEIHYSSCFDDDLISRIIQKYEQPDYSIYFSLKEKREKRKEDRKNYLEQRYGKRNSYRGGLNRLSLEEVERRKKIIDKYDKSEWGWKTKCSIELGISHTQLKRFLVKLNGPMA